jgi:hypothetical protein
MVYDELSKNFIGVPAPPRSEHTQWEEITVQPRQPINEELE